MLILAVILIVIGVVLLLAPIPLPNAHAVGWLFVLVGLILLLVALLLASDLGHGDDLARSSLSRLARSSWSRILSDLSDT